MAACNKDQEEEKQLVKKVKEMAYEGTNLQLDGIEGKIESFFVYERKIYVLARVTMEGECVAAAPKLYVANIDGSNVKEIPLPKMGESESMTNPFIDSSGKIVYLLNSSDQNSDTSLCYLIKTDEKGKEQMRENLTDSLKLTKNSRVIEAVADNKGNIAIFTDRIVYVLDEKLQLLCKLESDHSIDGGALTKDGTIICGYSDKDGAWVQTLDIEQKKWGKSYLLDLQYFRSPDWIMDGVTYDFYYKDDSGIYGYDMKEKRGGS